MTNVRIGGKCRLLLVSLLAFCVLLGNSLLAPARADEPAGAKLLDPPAPRPNRAKSDNSAEQDSAEQGGAEQGSENWLNKFARSLLSRETSEHARGHSSVLQAFRQVVQKPSKCTVRVFCREKQVALGTIVDSNGFIATKASELDGPVACELADGSRHDAELIGVDRGSDLALLRITAEGLPTIRWSENEPPTVGGWVVTPGPIDWPEAIGIVSVAPHYVRGGVLGIQMTEGESGPRITFVVPGSGAANAGLRRGDVISQVNRTALKDSSAMVAITSNMLPGDKLELTIRRQSQVFQVTARLGSVANTLSSRRARFQEGLGGPLSKRRVLFPSALEHDSVLQPNQCGGPLVDLDGRVIGINIARANRISCYALPTSIARPALESLMSQALLPVSSELRDSEIPIAPIE